MSIKIRGIIMDTVCGIEIQGSTANAVLLKGNKREYSIIQSEFKKIKLADEKNQSQIKSFQEVMENYLKQNEVERILVKRPSTSGKYLAGSVAFKIETILQMSSLPVILLHSNQIASLMKKQRISDDKYTEICKYQSAALETAFYGLED
jgi:putative lipoic acid-binding regulatory protein